VEQELVDNLQAAFQRSPQKSVHRASRELNVPKSTLHKVPHKQLHLQPYKVQLTQALEPSGLHQRAEFAASMLDSIEQDNQYLQRVMFSDEATFYVSGHVNRHNVRIWGSENPDVIREHV
jgi:hypothetical protein